MLKIFRVLIIAAIVFGLTWFYMLWQWQVSSRLVSPRDITIGLFVVPTVITAAISTVVTYVMRYVQMVRTARDIVKDAAETDEDAPAPVNTSYKPGAGLEVIQASVVTAAGCSYEDICKTLEEDPIAPLDLELTNEAGLLLPSRRVADLELIETESDEESDLTAGERRALALMAQALGETNETVSLVAQSLLATESVRKPKTPVAAQLHPAWSGEYTPDEPQTAPAAIRAPRVLEVLVTVSPRASEFYKTEVTKLLQTQLSANGLPEDKAEIRFLTPSEYRSIEEILNQKIDEAYLDRRARVMLVIASGSTIDQADIERWESQGLLDTPRGPRGKLPGEAACCLILRNAKFESTELPSTARISLWTRPEDAEKAKLSSVWKQLAGTDPDAAPKPGLALFSCPGLSKAAVDSSRFVTNKLPDLAEAENGYLCLGLAIGDCEPASDLVTLALAAQASATQQLAVLLAMNTQRSVRAMNLITPIEAPAT